MHWYYTHMHISRDFYSVSAVVNCPSSEHHCFYIRVFVGDRGSNGAKRRGHQVGTFVKIRLKRSGNPTGCRKIRVTFQPPTEMRELGPKMWPGHHDLARKKEGRLGTKVSEIWNLWWFWGIFSPWFNVWVGYIVNPVGGCWGSIEDLLVFRC